MTKPIPFLRVFLVIIVVIAGVILGNMPLKNLLANLLEQGYTSEVYQVADSGSLEHLGLPQWQELFFLFFPFVMGLSALLLAYPVILKKSPLEMIGPHPPFRWRLFLSGAGLWLFLAAVGDLIFYSLRPESYQWNFQPLLWLKLNFWLLIFIPLQTAAEEGFFRGFMMDAAGAWRGQRKRALWLPVILFTVAHMGNPEVWEYGWALMLPQYFLMSLFLGFLTLRDQGLERAWGVHLVNNWYGISLVNLETSTVPSESMLQVVEYDPLWGAISLFAAMAAFLGFQLLREKGQPQKS